MKQSVKKRDDKSINKKQSTKKADVDSKFQLLYQSVERFDFDRFEKLWDDSLALEDRKMFLLRTQFYNKIYNMSFADGDAFREKNASKTDDERNAIWKMVVLTNSSERFLQTHFNTHNADSLGRECLMWIAHEAETHSHRRALAIDLDIKLDHILISTTQNTDDNIRQRAHTALALAKDLARFPMSTPGFRTVVKHSAENMAAMLLSGWTMNDFNTFFENVIVPERLSKTNIYRELQTAFKAPFNESSHANMSLKKLAGKPVAERVEILFQFLKYRKSCS